MDAGEEQPLPAAQPADQRMLQRAGVLLVAGDGSGGPLDESLALGDLADEGRPVRVRQRPGCPARRPGRPAGTCRSRPSPRPGVRPARASTSWPTAWATFQSSSPPGRRRSASDIPSTTATSASARLASWVAVRSAEPAAARRRTSRRTSRRAPVSMPRQAATMSGAPVARASTHAEPAASLIDGRRPSGRPRAGRAAATSRGCRRPGPAPAARTRSASRPHRPGRAGR